MATDITIEGEPQKQLTNGEIMSKKEKLLLIDGHSIANRAFYALPPLTNSEGLHTNAVLGFINIFLNVYSKENPDYILVAFDLKAKTFRHKIFEAYKGTRKPMPEELHEQIPVLKDVLHAMNIKTVELEGYEADDIIGTYAEKSEKAGMDTAILSGDRDLLQLATDNTKIIIPKTKAQGTEVEVYFAKDVLEKYKVTPKEFIDVKALQGDASDNIPGIPGIGEKTAANIIEKYKSFENAVAHIDEIKPNKARENLKEFEEQGRLSKILATIVKDSPVELDFHDGKIESKADFYNLASYELFKKLEFKKILANFSSDDASSVAGASHELIYETESLENIDRILADLPEKVGFYTDKDLKVISFSYVKNDEKKILVLLNDKEIFLQVLQSRLVSFLNSNRHIYVLGLKTILHALNAGEIKNEKIKDAEIMAYLLNPLNTGYGYDYILKTYKGILAPSKEELLGKKTVREYLEETDTENCLKFAAYSADTALECNRILEEKLESEGMTKLFEEIEMPLVYSIYHMEKAGIRVEKEILDNLSKQLSEMAAEYEKEIFEEAGTEFNINSPKQLGVVLFEDMGLPHGKKTKTGYSTSADILEKLAAEYPFVNKILKYRQVTKLKSTYAEGLVNYISEDGRIHGVFNQTITATGRISSTEPNLQNIPTRTQLGQEIRKAFIPKEGCVFIDADYSQIELRIMADMAGDENLIEAYNSSADIHKITASKVFNTPPDEVSKEQRRNAKAVNFGIIYGISSFGLSQDLSITRKEAEGYIKQYFATYPQVKEFLDNTVKQARLNGYTTTKYARRRPIPELASSNFNLRQFGERAAMNAPIQGTAADIMKIAMINVDRALKENNLKSRIVLQVHDELLVEAPENEAETAMQIIKKEMSEAAKLKVALEVECRIGKDWYETH